jgi:uncharacterized protein
MVSNIVGNPVQGDDFFGREREVSQLIHRLEADSILLLAPRRVGKTSIMYRVREELADAGVLPVFFSVADVRSEAEFVERLFASVQNVADARNVVKALARGPLKNFLRRVKKFGFATVSVELADAGKEQWGDLGSALVRAMDELGKRCVLLVDEVPIFILELLRQDNTGARARTFLNWFRKIRLDPQTHRRIRWLLAGSIGLDTVTQRLRLGDTINDLFLYNELGPFSTDVADAFLGELGETSRLKLNNVVKERIREHIGWLIPYHLQIFFAKLEDRCKQKKSNPTIADVDAVYEDLLSPSNKGYFDYWEQRLTEELGRPDDKQALDLLAAVAKNPDGEAIPILRQILSNRIQDADERDQKLRYLLDVLQSDGYVVLSQDRYLFRSPLLRDYWIRRLLP